MPDHRKRRGNNLGRGTVVFAQVNFAQIVKILMQPCKAAAVCPAEAVNRLIGVADHKQAFAVRAPRAHECILHVVDVLKFVH